MKPPLILRLLLWPLAVLYGFIVRFRAWLYASGWLEQKHLKGTVISVGNITLGGTGKTPMVLWLAEKFLAEGRRVAILSRGYRGVDGTSDEVELMKSRLQGRVSFGVGKDRFAAGQKLEAQQAIDVFILDDGFQHLRLARDLDIVLIDSSRPLRKESLLPAGHLREPLSAMNRAGIVVFTRMEESPLTIPAIQKFPQFPIFPSTTKLLGFRSHSSEGDLRSLHDVGPGPFFAFCGIGNPDAFFRDLGRWGVRLVGQAAFPDHHRYTAAEAARLETAAECTGAEALLTTEKDAQNLGETRFSHLPLFIATITLHIPDETHFWRSIQSRMSARHGAAA